MFIYERKLADHGIDKGVATRRGIKLIESMNAMNMIIMNGIDSGHDFTFKSDNGQSINDYIIFSDSIINTLSFSSNQHELTRWLSLIKIIVFIFLIQ